MSTNNEKHGLEPNELDEALVRTERFYEKHLKTIIIVTSAIVIIVLAFFAYKYFVQEPKEEKAGVGLFMAEDAFINEQDSLSLNGNGKAFAGSKALAEEYSGTSAANLAHLYSGISLYDMGKYQEALAELQKFDGSDAYVTPSVIRLIGDTYVQLGKKEEAAKEYRKAADKANNSAISPSALLKLGHVYESMGKFDDAIKVYEEIKTKYYDAPESLNVEADIIRAKSQIK